jgi:hypothetical protein
MEISLVSDDFESSRNQLAWFHIMISHDTVIFRSTLIKPLLACNHPSAPCPALVASCYTPSTHVHFCSLTAAHPDSNVQAPAPIHPATFADPIRSAQVSGCNLASVSHSSFGHNTRPPALTPQDQPGCSGQFVLNCMPASTLQT